VFLGHLNAAAASLVKPRQVKVPTEEDTFSAIEKLPGEIRERSPGK
jgi:hypothetical protein